jgi:hypothetical protein
MPQNLFSDSKDLYNSKVKTTLDNLSKPSYLDNPPFIWPGATTHDLSTLDGTYKPLRGYIRRLNEFYKNMGIDSTNISNRKCNFQFQPESVVRNVAGNSYDTQYFFNQDPGQLTVPIPGQSTFNIKLLFNREAEVSRNQYLTGNKILREGKKNPSPTIFDNKDSLFATEKFDQSWVTKIGVLADILVLDAVIGQGINSETVSIIKKIADKAASAANATTQSFSTPGTTLTAKQQDAQDRKDFNAKAADFWTGQSGSNPNLGNQAFLVPTPVRIVLSNNMMVEGFVLQSAVNFHKFSRDFIPTQATVELSVQALYIGFSKQNTILTTPNPITTETGPDTPTVTTSQTLAHNAIEDRLKTIYKGSPKHQKSTQDLLKYLTLTETLHNFSFDMLLTDASNEYRNTSLTELTGGVSSFFWSGEIKMWWYQHVVGASNSRQLTRTSAEGSITLEKGAPNDSFLKTWGTEKEPFILATGSGKIVEELSNDATQLKPDDLDNKALKIVHKIKDETPGKWTVNLQPTIPKPFDQDKFVVEVTIYINLETGGAVYPVGQSITYKKTVAAGDDVLFKDATYGTRKTE